MERYNFIKEIGSGAFGSVWKAVNKQSGEVVAIKALKKSFQSWEECKNLREVKSLRKLNHPNIVKLKELVKENDVLYFVFEFMDCNLYELMKDRKNLFSEAEVRRLCFQVFQGLNYLHQNGYFHRDLKPENLLVLKEVIKIADFGLVREIDSCPPYTEYVSTRWYRAPEVLLHSQFYSSKVDMWAMGAIMVELFTLSPLFPGASEGDEMYKICSVIGSPTEDSWADGLSQARYINYRFPELTGLNLSLLLPSVSKDAVSLIESLCSWDPCKRPTAAEALQHPFFQRCFYVPPPLCWTAVDRRMYYLPSQEVDDPFTSGVQHKLKKTNPIQDADKNDNFMNRSAKQQKYSIKNCRTTLGVPDMVEELANMTTASPWESFGQPNSPELRTGNLFLRPQCGRTYTRKVVR
ncbi:hypothetical protein Pint_31013 [Pistacia integerrima]|uniref:Uncharacterized protein n=1 Tax=Pistacia integerrima TaxID=434235 RepID=A0ACC0XRM9_9ROSI|nr:hypothetical protein Pint_31013 [Pistacia integerrima]